MGPFAVLHEFADDGHAGGFDEPFEFVEDALFPEIALGIGNGDQNRGAVLHAALEGGQFKAHAALSPVAVTAPTDPTGGAGGKPRKDPGKKRKPMGDFKDDPY